jgi:hypothetical protein
MDRECEIMYTLLGPLPEWPQKEEKVEAQTSTEEGGNQKTSD